MIVSTLPLLFATSIEGGVDESWGADCRISWRIETWRCSLHLYHTFIFFSILFSMPGENRSRRIRPRKTIEVPRAFLHHPSGASENRGGMQMTRWGPWVHGCCGHLWAQELMQQLSTLDLFPSPGLCSLGLHFFCSPPGWRPGADRFLLQLCSF